MKTIKGIAFVIALSVMLSLLSSCAAFYDEEWIIGKTDDEIIERYGLFDTRTNSYTEDGEYLGWSGTYTIKEERKGYLQTYPEERLQVTFDTDNTAIYCKVVLGSPGN